MDPIAFQFGRLTVHWYGVMIALGFIAGLWTASRRAALVKVPGEMIFDLGPWLLVGSLIGARILYVVTAWEEFAKKPFPEIFMIHHGGLVFYGGFIGAVVTCLIYFRVKKLQVWVLADVLAPSISLGHAFGRFGCFLNGCCYGETCALPWAVHFPFGHETHPHAVHPTQLYEAVLNLAFYAALAWLFRRRKFDGQVFATYLIGYALLRSFVELFRGDYAPEQLIAGWITPAHRVSILILLAGLVLFWILRRFGRPAPKAV